MDTVDILRDRISDTEYVLDKGKLEDPTYLVLRNQLVIMDALKELLEDKDNPQYGKA